MTEALSFDAFFDLVKHMAVHMFEKNGEHMPLFYLQNADDGHQVGLMDACWADLDDKTNKFLTMRVGIDLGVIRQLCLVHEMWFAAYDKSKSVVDFNSEPAPSQRPDRKEMLMILCVDGSQHRIGHWEIRRPDPKKKPTLGEFMPADADSQLMAISSAFRGLLRDDGVKH